MEPSQIFGGAEECHSSESGWTMYIGSPIDDDGHSTSTDDGNNDNRDHYEATQADAEDESDDSMASDASSGPSHYGINPRGDYCKGSYGLEDIQQGTKEEYDENKYCLHKKANKTQEKEIEGKRVEKKEMVLIDTKGKSPAKVRKNYWVGKRK